MENPTIPQKFINPSVKGKFSTQVAIGSFAIGTTLFAAFYADNQNTTLLIAGFLFVSAAAFINGIIFLNLLYYFFMWKTERENLAIKMMIVLANLPIAAFYF